MIDHTQLRRGARFIIDGQPYEILDSMPMKKAQRRVVIQAKIRNLLTGTVSDRNFHQGDIFDEAVMERMQAKFIYFGKNKFVFCENSNPSNRFELSKEQIGNQAKYLKQNQVVDAVIFEEKIVGVSLPIKVQLKVKESPPGVKGDRAQGGTKMAVLETGAQINVPLFVEEGDIIEVNTEQDEYVKRVE